MNLAMLQDLRIVKKLILFLYNQNKLLKLQYNYIIYSHIKLKYLQYRMKYV